MKLKHWIFRLLVLLLAAAAALGFFLVRSKPARAAAMVIGTESAARYVSETMEAACRAEGKPQTRDPAAKLILESFQESLSYSLDGDLRVSDGCLTQAVTVRFLDVGSVTQGLGERTRELLADRVAAAVDVSEIYDERNEYREELVRELLCQAVRENLENKAQYGSTAICLEFSYEDGDWRMRPNGELDLMGLCDAELEDILKKARTEASSLEKAYWLRDEVLAAPRPDPACYGEAENPSQLNWLPEKAAALLDGQTLYFSENLEILPGSNILYYLDETILAVTWKQVIGRCVYTFSEVKIAHPSQLRRYLAGGEYDSKTLAATTEMSAAVHAVVASSGDFYRNRQLGLIVHDGIVERCDGKYMDTCCIDDQGNMIFVKRGELLDVETAQKFVDENHIRFSIAFGPVLIEDYQRIPCSSYIVGEIYDRYPRAALCQKDALHYVVVVANSETPYSKLPTLPEFGRAVESCGFEKAYTLDGGQTAVIAMHDVLVNKVFLGAQRQISDIFYFATAVPDGTAAAMVETDK